MSINIILRGMSPLMIHRYGSKHNVEPRGWTKHVKEHKEFKVAADRLHIDIEGNPVVPSLNIMAMLKTLKPSKPPYGIMSIEEELLPILSEGGWEIDERPAVINRNRILVVRPLFRDWGLNLTVNVDAEALEPHVLRAQFEECGKRIGLCELRPAKSGTYGRFYVEKFDVD